MSDCQLRAGSLESWRKDLPALHQEAVVAAQDHLFKEASFANDAKEMSLTRADGRGTFVLARDLRIVELSEADFMNMTGPGGLRRGLYHSRFGKILLNREHWCLKTLYHEALHSLPVFSRGIDLNARSSTLVNGLTEMFAGVLLYKTKPLCYENCWRKRTGRECAYTYRPYTNYFCALAQIVPISEIVRLYFWKVGSTWETEFRDFVHSIRGLGYPKFANILSINSTWPLADLLHDECIRTFGAQYEATSDSDPDLSKALL